MGKFHTLAIGAAGLLGASIASTAVQAQIVSTHCGLGTNNVTATLYYDPFNPNPINQVSTTLPLSRYVGTSSGAKTQQVDFYFTQPNGSPAYVITSTDSTASNLLYNEASPGSGPEASDLSETTQGAGTLEVNFGGTAQPDAVGVPITITVPAGLDLVNGLTVSFGIVYECKGTGGLASEGTPQYIPNAVTLPLRVLSALQANYAGPAVDFGDVQGATASNYATYLAPVSGPGDVDVQSSGPYDVTVSSANNYVMTNGASGAANTIQYSLKFLGQTLSPSSATFSAVHCERAGVIGGQQLPLRATLGEAANAKTVASYQDTLTITITPTNEVGLKTVCSSL